MTGVGGILAAVRDGPDPWADHGNRPEADDRSGVRPMLVFFVALLILAAFALSLYVFFKTAIDVGDPGGQSGCGRSGRLPCRSER